MGKVECRVESSKFCGIFLGLGNHSLELVLGLVAVLAGFPFLGLEARHLLREPRHFDSKPPYLPLATEE